LSACRNSARVLVLECAPEEVSGGNSRFTAGAIRFAYGGLDDLRAVVTDLTDDEIATTDFGTYTEDQFSDDMFRVTRFRTDPDLCEVLVRQSLPTMIRTRETGVRFVPIYGRQAFKIDGRFKFWGGLTVESVGVGPGLVEMLTNSASKAGIDIMYETRALSLVWDGGPVPGVKVAHRGELGSIAAEAVVLAAGELTGGIFYHGYRGGTGLMYGAVFGRIAGAQAAVCAKA